MGMVHDHVHQFGQSVLWRIKFHGVVDEFNCCYYGVCSMLIYPN